MKTVVLRTKTRSLARIVRMAGKVLKKGGLVAFPTETVYGLGGNALSDESSKKIYAAKGRPSDNPLIVHVGNVKDVEKLVESIPEKAVKLMEAFWPGPLTLIFPKSGLVPKETTGGLDTVAIRMPSHPVAAALLKSLPFPVAAPSANLSGRPSTTEAYHVIEDLSGRVDMIIDDGDVPIGVESTILDLTGEVPTLLRPGFITVEEMERVIGKIEVDPAIETRNLIEKSIDVRKPKAPGMKYRHYAPKAEMTIISGPEAYVADYINANADDHTGILATEERKELYRKGVVVTVGHRSDPNEIAHHLFEALRTFDELKVTRIYSEDLSDSDIGTAIMNRLLKAAGGNYKVIDKEDLS
ncbi:MAG: threonylcarbamoyl-AMP synthase [Lachnospiraceae bacterium]|nr:threonylcarbamoyl-AMP synthase [Lachnospiraceae bacterium]